MPFTTPILDNFNRANEAPLNPTNWQARKNGGGTTTAMRVLSNQAACDAGGGQSYAVWTPLGSMTNCEAYATMVNPADRMDVIGRMKPGIASDFAVYCCAHYNTAFGGVILRVYDESGALPNANGTGGLAWTAQAGDKLGITMSGMVATAYAWRGGSWTTGPSATLGVTSEFAAWGGLTTGLIGMSIRTTGSAFDDFGGGVFSLLPVADFTGTPTSGLAPLTVTFTNLSTG
jgi:hypothetical protein